MQAVFTEARSFIRRIQIQLSGQIYISIISTQRGIASAGDAHRPRHVFDRRLRSPREKTSYAWIPFTFHHTVFLLSSPFFPYYCSSVLLFSDILTMANPRLPFLYPNFMRAIRSCEPTTYRSIRIPSNGSRHVPFHTSRRKSQEAYHRRYGPAAEANLPPPPRPKGDTSDKTPPSTPAAKDTGEASSKPSPPEPQSQAQDRESKDNAIETSSRDKTKETAESAEQAESKPSSDEPKEPTTTDDHNADEHSTSSSSTEEASEQRPDSHPHPLSGNPLEGVLHMPSPSSFLAPSSEVHNSTNGDGKPPHLTPAPYVHHFDTYSLVQDLSKGGFTEDQSVTIMKAVRRILQNNLDLAKQSLTSKSDVENESYLFKAACSELQSSLQTARNSEMQRQRASRTQLQHEADILSQRLNQELAGLKDDIKGMFNDHKMATREQQRSIDTSVQELNYKITVSLNSDGKSEIEGLRWILTRRAALAIATSAGECGSICPLEMQY